MMIPQISSQCMQRNHPSKKLAAYADGYDDRGEYIGVKAFTCSNVACTIARERFREERDEADRRATISKMNLDAGRDFSRVEAVRAANQIIIGDVVAILGITPTDYCKYRGNDVPVPADVWERCLLLLAVYEGEGERG